MRGAVLVDARNLLDPERVVAAGLRYEGVGRRLDVVDRNDHPGDATKRWSSPGARGPGCGR